VFGRETELWPVAPRTGAWVETSIIRVW